MLAKPHPRKTQVFIRFFCVHNSTCLSKIFRLVCLSLFYTSLLATFLSTLRRSCANEHFVQYFHDNAKHHLKSVCNDTQASGNASSTVNCTVSTTVSPSTRTHTHTRLAPSCVRAYDTSISLCTNELIQIVRQAQLIFITFEATCFDLTYRSSSGLHTIESSNAVLVGIPSCSHL